MSILACNTVPLCSLWGLLLGFHIFLKSFDFLGYVGHLEEKDTNYNYQ